MPRRSREQPRRRHSFHPLVLGATTTSLHRRNEDEGENGRWDTEKADPVASVDALDCLIPRSEIRFLTRQKSNSQGWMQIAWHFGWLAIMAAASPVMDLLSAMGMAWVSAFYFCGLHETVHRTAFRSRFWNDFWAQVFGILTFRPARHYWYYHWQHHRYTGNPKLDSELQPGSWLDMDIQTPGGYILYLSGIPFWIDAIGNNLIRHAKGSCPEVYLESSSSSESSPPSTQTQTKNKTKTKNNKAQAQVIWEARLYLLVYGALATAASCSTSMRSSLFRFWILPALLGQPILRGYLLGEHHGRKQSPIIYENTRTMQTNGWIRRFAWNMPYHLEHHAWPAIPFWKLPEVHSLLENQITRRSTTTNGSKDTSPAPDEKRFGEDSSSWWDQGEEEMLSSTNEEPMNGRDGYLRFNWKYFRSLIIRS